MSQSRPLARWLLGAGLAVAIAACTYQLPKSYTATSIAYVLHGSVGEADGVVSRDVSVFDSSMPAVTNLDADLLGALRHASTDAGITFSVSSGWRSPEYQNQLLRDAVATYGSEAEAARWVATAATSQHVKGAAVDIANADATAWLSRHGAEYGLCQIYENEPWHYELRPKAAGSGCPVMYADPTQDPRTQQ
ncbi:M15 family metallopeptidase [Smaragdicoccus niigatensis]|uniref:M15 family metallopeptidase n=1 Tax=Smaragdicoccus niigatensis TaxID=359359 RepID=UPI0003AB46A6|nr:M15 family metallopeptidase [Smaragdicoccus niigatensis]